MEAIFINTENSKADETLQFVLNLSKRLDLRSSNKNVALQNFSIYYMWKNIRKQDKNSKLKQLLQYIIMNLNYQVVLILFQIFEIILNLSQKSLISV